MKKSKAKEFLTVAAFVMLAFFALGAFLLAYQRREEENRAKYAEVEFYRRRVAAKRLEVTAKEKRLQALTTDEGIKAEAREELMLVEDGEIPVMVKGLEEDQEAPEVEPPAEERRGFLSRAASWLSSLFGGN